MHFKKYVQADYYFVLFKQRIPASSRWTGVRTEAIMSTVYLWSDGWTRSENVIWDFISEVENMKSSADLI